MAARLTTMKGRQPRKFFGLWFSPGANLGRGVLVVGVVEQLAASLAVRPVNARIAAARIPVDAASRGEGVVALARGFLAFPAAVVLVHFLLPLADGALHLLCELGLQLGVGGGKFGVAGLLLESEK